MFMEKKNKNKNTTQYVTHLTHVHGEKEQEKQHGEQEHYPECDSSMFMEKKNKKNKENKNTTQYATHLTHVHGEKEQEEQQQ